MDTDTLLAALAISISVLVFGVLMTGAVLVVRDTVRKRGRWGVNTSIPDCPRCGVGLPAVRVPANFRQGLWGGWTCPECQLEVDKWGHPLPGQDFPPELPADLDEAKRRFGRRGRRRDEGRGDDIRRGGEIRDDY